jgi:hypothetical protein
MGNCRALIMSDRIRFAEKSDTEIRPGAILRVTGTAGEDLKENIMPLNFDGANPQMFEITDKIYQYAQSSMQAPSVLSGDPGKSGETFRGIAARIEQATKQTSVSTRKFGDGLEWVLKANAFLNSIHMNDEELFHVAMEKGQQAPSGEKGGRAVRANYHFEIRADLRFVTQSQRIQEADELLHIISTIPPLQGNLSLLWQIMAGVFRSRGRDDLVAFLGPAPPPPPLITGEPPPAPPPMPMGPPGPNGPMPNGRRRRADHTRVHRCRGHLTRGRPRPRQRPSNGAGRVSKRCMAGRAVHAKNAMLLATQHAGKSTRFWRPAARRPIRKVLAFALRGNDPPRLLFDKGEFHG